MEPSPCSRPKQDRARRGGGRSETSALANDEPCREAAQRHYVTRVAEASRDQISVGDVRAPQVADRSLGPGNRTRPRLLSIRATTRQQALEQNEVPIFEDFRKVLFFWNFELNLFARSSHARLLGHAARACHARWRRTTTHPLIRQGCGLRRALWAGFLRTPFPLAHPISTSAGLRFTTPPGAAASRRTSSARTPRSTRRHAVSMQMPPWSRALVERVDVPLARLGCLPS